MEKISEIYTGAANGSFEVGQLLFEEGDFRLYLTLDELGRNDSLLLIRKSEVKQLVDQSEYLTEISRRRELLNQKGLADPFDLSAKVRQLKPDQAVESFLSMLPGQVVYFGLVGNDYQQWGYLEDLSDGKFSFIDYPTVKYQNFTGEVDFGQIRRLAAFSGEWIMDNPELKEAQTGNATANGFHEIHFKADDSFAVGQLLCEENDYSLYLTVDEVGRNDSLMLVNKKAVDEVVDQSAYLQDITRCHRQLLEKSLADPFEICDKAKQITQVADFWRLATGQVVSFAKDAWDEPNFGLLKDKEGDALTLAQYPSRKYDTFAGQVNLTDVDYLEAFGGELTFESTINNKS